MFYTSMFCLVDWLCCPAIKSSAGFVLTWEYRVLPTTLDHPGHLFEQSPVLLLDLCVSIYNSGFNTFLVLPSIIWSRLARFIMTLIRLNTVDVFGLEGVLIICVLYCEKTMPRVDCSLCCILSSWRRCHLSSSTLLVTGMALYIFNYNFYLWALLSDYNSYSMGASSSKTGKPSYHGSAAAAGNNTAASRSQSVQAVNSSDTVIPE